MELYRKQFVFDLKADKHSPIFKFYNSLSGAYDDIRKIMVNNGFEHRQGSSYVSLEPMDDKQVRKFLKKMCKELPWLAECSKAFDIANIGKQHNLILDIEETCNLFADKKEIWLNKMNNSSFEDDDMIYDCSDNHIKR